MNLKNFGKISMNSLILGKNLRRMNKKVVTEATREKKNYFFNRRPL